MVSETKLMLAIKYDSMTRLGRTVAICVNDIIAAGGAFSISSTMWRQEEEPAKLEQVVAGVAEGCVQAALPH